MRFGKFALSLEELGVDEMLYSGSSSFSTLEIAPGASFLPADLAGAMITGGGTGDS
jgi:hypothetical protein